MQKVVLLFILSSIICVMHAGEWITLPNLQTIVGYGTADDGSVVLNNPKKNYLFQKMRVTFSSNSPEAYSYILIRYENGNTALEFSFESWYSYRIRGIRWENYFNKTGSIVSSQPNTREYNLCKLCNSSDDQYFYVSSWQKNFIPEQVQIYVEQSSSIATVATNGVITGGGKYDINSMAILTATPNECYHFTQWSDGNTDNPRSIVVNRDATYTAEFSPNQDVITILSNDENQGIVSIEKD